MIFFRKKENPSTDSGQVEKANPEQSRRTRARIFVSGKVQGVFFRENTSKNAKKLGVKGWVKNLQDGRVEAIFEGDRDNVEKLINWARKGPFWAKVNGLDFTFEEYKGEFEKLSRFRYI